MKLLMKPDAMSAYCAKHGVSRDELARQMKVSSATAWRVQHGHTDPSPKFIAALMSATGQPFEELFEVTDEVAV